MCCGGEVYKRLVVAKTHHDYTARASGTAGNARNGCADDGSRIGDHHQVVVVIHCGEKNKAEVDKYGREALEKTIGDAVSLLK